MSATAIWLAERYAQRQRGGRLHLVADFGDERVAAVARCGVRPRDGCWRMTSNVPLAHACRRCPQCRPRYYAVEVGR